MTFAHEVKVIVDGITIDAWSSMELKLSMIDGPASFNLTRPFTKEFWRHLRRDARIRVTIDGASQLVGFVEQRQKTTERDGGSMLTIMGRNLVGRLHDDSAPSISYDGLEMSQAILKLAEPWFSRVTLTDARDRKLRTGKNRYKVLTGTEPATVVIPGSKKRKTGSIRVQKTEGSSQAQPGESRWSVIQKVLEQIGAICWSSSDGKELFVGLPNHEQVPKYLVTVGRPDLTSLIYDEDNGDRYSLIAVVGSGGGTEQDHGITVSNRRAYVTDNEDNAFDGTGRDFVYPKRLLMAQKTFRSIDEASRIAGAEQLRRDFRRIKITATMAGFGQEHGPGKPTLYAYNTLASVRDDEMDLDEDYMIYSVAFTRNRDGDTTTLEMVPRWTEIIA